MSGFTQERYNYQVVGLNSTVTVTGQSIGGFLAKTSGTIRMVRGQNNTVILDDIPVTAGTYLPLPFFTGTHGGTFSTAGGASGVLAVG